MHFDQWHALARGRLTRPRPPRSTIGLVYTPQALIRQLKDLLNSFFLVFVVCVCVSCSHVFTRCMFVDDREKDERRRRSHSHPGPDYTEQMFLPPGAMRGHHHISRFHHFLILYSSVTFFLLYFFFSLFVSLISCTVNQR